ncbi:MAG TPA: hypothetical protein VFZ65_20820 [Planctomycetota bacterium]|nr:hypothetical protein [Planctomycetota bacterium]
MAKPKRTWREKLLDSKDLPRVEKVPARLAARWGKGTFVIPAPIEVDAMMRAVPRGKLTTVNEIRAALAQRHRATIACPMTTGIFAVIAARAADEQERVGKARVTPYWRTLKQGGELNPKFPGGVEVLRTRLEAEGHEVEARGKRWFVVDHGKRLARLARP